MPAPKDPEKYALYIERLRVSHTGKKPSPETRAKMAAAQQARRARAPSPPRPDMVGDKNPMRRPEVAAKVGAAHRGKPKSPEQRAKIAATLRLPEVNSYQVAHARVKAERGRASARLCAFCDARAKDWALIAGRGQSRRNKGASLAYSTDVNDYFALCEPCHRRYDYHG